MNCAVIIPAGGSGARYQASGGMRSKLDEDLGGRAVLLRTVELFTKRDCVKSIIVAGPADQDAFGEFKDRHGTQLGFHGVQLVPGGAEFRWQSVRAALECVPPECTHVAVHDAARPCASERLLDRVFDAAETNGAVVPGVNVSDTLKRVGESEAGEEDPLDAILGSGGKANASVRTVVGEVERAGLVAVQTPQVFEAALFRRAYAQDDLASTDDAGLIQRLGETVTVVEGDPLNIKLTLEPDLMLARAVLGVKAPKQRESHKRF